MNRHPGANHIWHALWKLIKECFGLKEEPRTTHFGLFKLHFMTKIFCEKFLRREEHDVILNSHEDYFSPFAQVQITPVTCGVSVLIVQSPYYQSQLPEIFFDEELA